MKSDITKVSSHISLNEQLIFERSQQGRIGYRLPPLDVDETPVDEILAPALRRDDDLAGLPEVSEVDVIRHFVRMSTWNYSIDLGMYPLGSCTMKYNSRLNEKVARINTFANLHPLAEEQDAQGALQVIYELQGCLSEITGLPGVSLQPAAGAHGEIFSQDNSLDFGGPDGSGPSSAAVLTRGGRRFDAHESKHSGTV